MRRDLEDHVDIAGDRADEREEPITGKRSSILLPITNTAHFTTGHGKTHVHFTTDHGRVHVPFTSGHGRGHDLEDHVDIVGDRVDEREERQDLRRG